MFDCKFRVYVHKMEIDNWCYGFLVLLNINWLQWVLGIGLFFDDTADILDQRI